MGDLRGGRPGHRLRNLPPRAPAAAELGVHPAVRPRAGRGWVWAAPWTSWRSSRRCSGRPRRSAWARQTAAASSRAASWARVSTTLLVVIIVTLTICFILRRCPEFPRASSGFPTSTWCWLDPGPGRVRRRTDGADPQPAPTAIGDYFSNLGQISPARRPPAATRRRPGSPAGRSSTGRGGSPDALRRHVHRLDQPGPHDPAVRRGCRADPERREPALVRDLRRRGDQPAAQWDRPLAFHRGAAVRAASTRCRSARWAA